MTTKFCVVRYLPHPLSGEMINVGLIAWGDGKIVTQFMKDWRRIKTFGHEDISFLQDFVGQIETSTSPNQLSPTVGPGQIDTKRLEELVANWSNSIQFSEPRTSLKSPEDVLREVGSIYLPGMPHRQQRSRTRRTAARLALNSVSQVLIEERGPLSEDLVKKHHGIRGKFDEHQFDVAVANGRTFLAAQGLSFEKSFSREIQKDVDATAWAIDDIRKIQRTMPVAVLALPPRDSSKHFDQAKKTFRGLRADMVLESQMDAWVKRALKAVPARAR